jgi:hypothetical protein
MAEAINNRQGKMALPPLHIHTAICPISRHRQQFAPHSISMIVQQPPAVQHPRAKVVPAAAHLVEAHLIGSVLHCRVGN